MLRSINEDLYAGTADAVPSRSVAVFAFEDAEPLPSMFRRQHSTGVESKGTRSNAKARLSAYIIALVVLGFAPVQAALLISSFPINREKAIEELLILAKQSAAEIATLLSAPSAKKRDAYSLGDLD